MHQLWYICDEKDTSGAVLDGWRPMSENGVLARPCTPEVGCLFISWWAAICSFLQIGGLGTILDP